MQQSSYDLTWWKDITSVIQSVVTTLALLVAAGWFLWRREGVPRASLSCNITHKPLNDQKLLLHIVIEIENIGNVLLRPRDGNLNIYKVSPLTKGVLRKIENRTAFVRSEDSIEIDWSEIVWTSIEEPRLLLKSVVLEPQESHQVCFDCLLNLPIEIVKIHFYFQDERRLKAKNGDKTPLVWSFSTLYKL